MRRPHIPEGLVYLILLCGTIAGIVLVLLTCGGGT